VLLLSIVINVLLEHFKEFVTINFVVAFSV
jgi:hypothetical protein